MTDHLPLGKPGLLGRELEYVDRCVREGQAAGDGAFTRRCQQELEAYLGAPYLLLTTSGASALHMAALLCGLGPGDEVVMPSFADADAANAVLAVGARPVFADVEPDTLNLDPADARERVTARTRALVASHRFGTACDMAAIQQLAEEQGIPVIEDAADGFGARYRGRCLGTMGDFGALSFHETRDIGCGDAGALVLRDDALFERAEIIREKGTNRSQFFRGKVDKYTWVDVGSSYVPSDVLAAFLAARLEHTEAVLARKRDQFAVYREALSPVTERRLLRLPVIPPECESNHQGFFALAESAEVRRSLVTSLSEKGIAAAGHPRSLHESAMGQRLGCESNRLPVTENVSRRLLQLPSFHALSDDEIRRVARAVCEFYRVAPTA